MSDDSEKAGISKPPRYTGDGTDKTPAGLRQFKVYLKDYLALMESISMTSVPLKKRISSTHVNSFLTGKAATYFSAIRDQVPPTPSSSLSKKRFIPSTSQSELIQQWNHINQFRPVQQRIHSPRYRSHYRAPGH